MLHPVNSPKGRVKWCGPTALAALTGLSYEEAIDLLKAVRVRAGRRNPTVKGVQNGDMFLALLRMGYEAERIKVQTVGLTKKGEPQTETFAAFLSRRSGHLRDAPILVNVTRHYLAVKGAWGIESRTEGNAPISVMELGSRRARMEHAWEIVRTRRVDAKAVIAEARAAAERLGVAAADCLVFEDAEAGIAAGEAAGCDIRIVTAAWTHPLETRHPTLADYGDLRLEVGPDRLRIAGDGSGL